MWDIKLCSIFLPPSPEGDLGNEEKYDAGPHLAAARKGFIVVLIKYPFSLEPRVLSLSLSGLPGGQSYSCHSPQSRRNCGKQDTAQTCQGCVIPAMQLLAARVRRKKNICRNTLVVPDTTCALGCAQAHSVRKHPFPKMR